MAASFVTREELLTNKLALVSKWAGVKDIDAYLAIASLEISNMITLSTFDPDAFPTGLSPEQKGAVQDAVVLWAEKLRQYGFNSSTGSVNISLGGFSVGQTLAGDPNLTRTAELIVTLLQRVGLIETDDALSAMLETSQDRLNIEGEDPNYALQDLSNAFVQNGKAGDLLRLTPEGRIEPFTPNYATLPLDNPNNYLRVFATQAGDYKAIFATWANDGTINATTGGQFQLSNTGASFGAFGSGFINFSPGLVNFNTGNITLRGNVSLSGSPVQTSATLQPVLSAYQTIFEPKLTNSEGSQNMGESLNELWSQWNARKDDIGSGGGGTPPDLGNYFTKAETNALLGNYYLKSQTYSRAEVDTKIAAYVPTKIANSSNSVSFDASAASPDAVITANGKPYLITGTGDIIFNTDEGDKYVRWSTDSITELSNGGPEDPNASRFGFVGDDAVLNTPFGSYRFSLTSKALTFQAKSTTETPNPAVEMAIWSGDLVRLEFDANDGTPSINVWAVKDSIINGNS